MGRQPGAPFFYFYKERLGTGSPPHPPQCAHWGTFPPRGRLLHSGVVRAITGPIKMLSSIFPLENASQIGFRIPEVIAPRTDQRQRSPKRANESERAINPGVQGAPPPALFLPISREKWGPPPGRRAPRGTAPRGCFRATHPKGTQHRAAPGRGAGFGPAQGQTCAGPNGTTYRRQRTPAGQAAPPGPTQGKHCSQGLTSPEFVVSFKS